MLSSRLLCNLLSVNDFFVLIIYLHAFIHTHTHNTYLHKDIIYAYTHIAHPELHKLSWNKGGKV